MASAILLTHSPLPQAPALSPELFPSREGGRGGGGGRPSREGDPKVTKKVLVFQKGARSCPLTKKLLKILKVAEKLLSRIWIGLHDDDSGSSHDGMVNKQFVAWTTRNKTPPRRRLGFGLDGLKFSFHSLTIISDCCPSYHIPPGMHLFWPLFNIQNRPGFPSCHRRHLR